LERTAHNRAGLSPPLSFRQIRGRSSAILGIAIEAAIQTDSVCPVHKIADDEPHRFLKLQRFLLYEWSGALTLGNPALESPKGRQALSAGVSQELPHLRHACRRQAKQIT
jgi:hypothetical protein